MKENLKDQRLPEGQLDQVQGGSYGRDTVTFCCVTCPWTFHGPAADMPAALQSHRNATGHTAFTEIKPDHF
ncbi:MAG: hypothetical protein KBA08_01280 [Firmicutes bacterium]|nr:hypothetical protein [Bacillota bacterium]